MALQKVKITPLQEFEILSWIVDGSGSWTIEGDLEVEIVDLYEYVQVSIFDRLPSALWTYRDDFGLEVGDLVKVPFGDGEKYGLVARLGRGSYSGKCKSVTAKYVLEEGGDW